MIHHTRAIVLRHTKYGDSSIIVQLFTETLGLISVMAKGARNAKKNKVGNLYQLGNLLDVVLFYQPSKNFQIINEVKIAYLYQQISESMTHNCVMQFALENLQQIVAPDVPQEELFYFSFDFLMHLDKIETAILANVPMYYLMQLIQLNGYKIEGAYGSDTPYFDLNQGKFVATITTQTIFIEGEKAEALCALNQQRALKDVLAWQCTKAVRAYLVDVLIKYMQIHILEFRNIKSLAILNAILA